MKDTLNFVGDAFYRLRPALKTPKWRRLARSSGLDLPGLETSFRLSEKEPAFLRWRVLLMFGALGCLWAGLGPVVFLVSTLFFAFGFEYACWLVFRNVPRRILTIGELAREAAGCSFAKLSTENKECAPSDRWFALTAILRGITGHETAITRETTFFAKHAMPAA